MKRRGLRSHANGRGAEACLVLTLLGGFQAHRDPASALVLPTRKARALLAYLAIPLGRAHSREKLAGLLWGDMPDAQARGNLRQAVSRIQRALATSGVRGLIVREDTVALDPSAVEVDVAGFEARLADGRPDALEQAVSRYRGDLLEGLVVPERPFEEWVAAERERLRGLAIEALERLLAQQSTSGAVERAVQTALRLLALDPVHEDVHRLVMRFHAQLGRRAAALRQYQVCVEVLKREFGAEPAAETRQLYQEILRQRPAGVDPGESSSPVTATVPSPCLPSPVAVTATPLIGRDEVMGTLRALLDEASAGRGRVVALIGEAGIGKSRLLAELGGLASQRGVRILVGRAYETEQILPFGPWVDALRADRVVDDEERSCGLPPAERSAMARLLRDAGEGARATGSPANVVHVFTAFAESIAAAAARYPLVMILEDLHWADEMSVRLLAFLGRRLRGWPVLLAVSARAELLADTPRLQRTLDELLSESHVVWTEVGPLSEPDTLRLAEQVISPDAGGEARARIARQAWRLGEGNPFVVLETVRAAGAAGAAEAEGVSVPERVTRLIVHWLERLEEPARQLASVAAVIGRDFDFDFGLLRRASGLGDDEAVTALDVLLRHRILRRDGERFAFRHERIRDVAAGLVSAPRRALINRRVAESSEALPGHDHPTLLPRGAGTPMGGRMRVSTVIVNNATGAGWRNVRPSPLVS